MESSEGKKHHYEHQSSKSSRSASPVPGGEASPRHDDYRPPLGSSPPSHAGPPPSPPVPLHPKAPVAPEPSGPQSLMPCGICGRTFLPPSLVKHSKICEKMTSKKRKTFDSSRQRREGTDMEQFLPKNFGLPENSPFLEKSPQPSAKPTPKPKQPSVRNIIAKPATDLQRCPHCSRNFGVRAFERHVEWCGDKAKILPAAPAQPPPHIADAKQRLNARTQYKAPPVRGRRSSQTRDVSSNSRSASVESTRGISPPREYGDYKHARARASESVSSNDYHEDNSPHIPVIRNTRHSLSNSSGDAHVKARQARLARDLSNTRTQDQSPVRESKDDQNIVQTDPPKPLSRMTIKKRQQLKKLEQIASKYGDREKERLEGSKSQTKPIKREKSMIPIPKKKNSADDFNDDLEEITGDQLGLNSCTSKHSKNYSEKQKDLDYSSKMNEIPIEKPSRSNNFKNRIPISRRETPKELKCNAPGKNKKNSREKELKKENSMSIDSLEDVLPYSAKGSQSAGIKTDILCVPCVIHKSGDSKVRKQKKRISSVKADKEKPVVEPSVELIYKNPIIVASCDLRITDNVETIDPKEYLSTCYSIQSTVTVSESSCNIASTSENIGSNYNLAPETSISDFKIDSKEIKLNNHKSEHECESEGIDDLSAENFVENVELDNSHEFNSIETSENVLEAQGSALDCSSGQTYTKFTENADDFEEFITLTDQLMNKSEEHLEETVNILHMPQTNSLETINTDNSEETQRDNFNFSDTFQDLKMNFKKLIECAGDKILLEEKNVDKLDEEENKKVHDMEHITVYGLKFYNKEINNKIPTIANEMNDEQPTEKEESLFKLPSIEKTNKPERKKHCNKNRMQKIYQTNKKYKMFYDNTRDKNDFKTFIINNEDSDSQSISSDAPPLKLPRIDIKRLDENYDPFASAARQMKELMSTDTKLSKSNSHSSKDLSRTLPILRPNKEKGSTNHNSNTTTKMMKDTLNKSYQKTPTLQRMKSFGSTNNDYNTFGGRSSSFRIRNEQQKSSQKLNTTFTKSSKENISTIDKSYFNRNSNLNRSFSSYNTSSYSTPKPKDKIYNASSYSTPKPKEKIPKIATSMYHSFQRTTIKQPVKLDKIKRDDEKKDYVSLGSILTDDNSSMTDSNYIDPRLINENDNLPINVNTILNNPEIISSMESLLTTENLPAKFESFNSRNLIDNNKNLSEIVDSNRSLNNLETNNNYNNKTTVAGLNSMSTQYDKVITSLEQSLNSKTSIRDDESLCEDFDLEEFMTTFDEEITHKLENKRSCSSTTRVVKQSELIDSNRNSEFNSVSSTPKLTNGMNPVNKSMSLTFSSSNTVNENLFPSSVKRSTSLLDSIQKKITQKVDSAKQRHKVDQLEQDLMQSLKDFDKMYATEKDHHSSKESIKHNGISRNGTVRRDPRAKTERKIKNDVSNGSFSNGKASNDSAYSSLNRISPAKLTVCTTKEPNGHHALEPAPVVSDSSSHKDDVRSISSEEFLAMERCAELDEPLPQPDIHPVFKDTGTSAINGKRVSSRASTTRSPTWRGHGALSSSSSEASLHRGPGGPARRDSLSGPRLSRFCHECGTRFSVDTAKFCIECGVKRLTV